MNIALIIGKKKSTGIKGKNVRNILGRPSVEYAFIAAKYSVVDHIFVSTDCDSSIKNPFNSPNNLSLYLIEIF